MMRHMPKEDWRTELCKRCGQAPRADSLKYCQACAETLALRGLLAPLPAKDAEEAHAAPDPELTPADKAP